MMISFSRKQIFYFAFIAMLVLATQIIGIRRPFLGHYASYQATVMASISRNMLRDNFSDLLKPKTDSIIGGERSLHLNQYPFPSLLAAICVRLLGGTLEFWGRFQAVLFNLLSAVFLYLIAKRLFGPLIGCLSFTIYALSPYTLIYGQCFMSESMSLFFLLFAFFLLLYPSEKGIEFVNILFSAFSFSIAVTGRIHFLLFFPVYLMCVFFDGGTKKWYKSFSFVFASIALPVAWYGYTCFISAHAHNIHTNIFLQLAALHNGNKNLLISPEYYRVVFDTFSQIMLTPLLFPFLFLGLSFAKWEKDGFKYIAGLILCGGLVIVLSPQKVIRHDFYLYGIFPFVAILTACGIGPVLNAFPFLKITRAALFFIIMYFGVSARFFFHPIFKSSPGEKNVIRTAQAIQTQTQPNDYLIVVGRDLGPMLYYANRPGWPLQLDLIGKPVALYLKNSHFAQANLVEIDQLEKAMKNAVTWVEYFRLHGAKYLAVPNKRELEIFPELLTHLKNNYKIISRGKDDFYLFRLTS